MISKIKSYTAVILILLFNTPVFAAPNGANVVHGNVNITQSGSNTIINQSSDKAIVNWNSFDLSKGESVQFNQHSQPARHKFFQTELQTVYLQVYSAILMQMVMYLF